MVDYAVGDCGSSEERRPIPIDKAGRPSCASRVPMHADAKLPISVGTVKRRLNALARPRRGLLHTPDNSFDDSEDDPGKPWCGHWQDGRFRLRHQQVSGWHTLHQWRPHFDGQVATVEGGNMVRVQASLGTAQSVTVLLIGLALLGTGLINIPLQHFDWLVSCGLAALLVGGAYAYLTWALRRLPARLAGG